MGADLIAGGYLLAKPGSAIPAGALTASSCLADMAPDMWAIEWVKATDSERLEQAQRLGLDAASVPDLVEWATSEFDSGLLWPNVFTGVEKARETGGSS